MQHCHLLVGIDRYGFWDWRPNPQRKDSGCWEYPPVVLHIVDDRGYIPVGKRITKFVGQIHFYGSKGQILFCTISLIRNSFIFLTGAFPLFQKQWQFFVKYNLVIFFCFDKMAKKKIGEYFILWWCFLFLNVTLWNWDFFHVLPFYFHAKNTNSDICAFSLKFIDNYTLILSNK